jgi:hypothetical protein
MAKKDLHSLDRFRKRSPKLIYEEHRAPVGCGGVVMRWRDPMAALPVTIHFYCPVKATLYLDGQPLEATGIDLAPGPHLFAITTDADIDLSGGLFMFAALHEPDYIVKTKPEGVNEPAWQFRSSTGGAWRALTEPPIEYGIPWTSPDFDESTWQALTHSVTPPTVNWQMHGAVAAHWCIQNKAAFLALPKGTKGKGRVWVRVRVAAPLPKTT